MFDKTLFDRNAFNRSVSSDGTITATINTSSGMQLKINLIVPISSVPLSGSGQFNTIFTGKQNMSITFSGSGKIEDTTVSLQSKNSLTVSGTGTFKPEISVKTPLKANLSGTSSMVLDSRVYIIQNMTVPLSGFGVITNSALVDVSIHPIFSGVGSLTTALELKVLIGGNLKGEGTVLLRRLSAFNEVVFELIGITLEPGQTLTIDTDSLQVLFGSIEDVSSVTTDSVFLELNPGQNDISISTDSSDATLDVLAVWQNRWL